jgi:arylsulfatase A-like enzyme
MNELVTIKTQNNVLVGLLRRIALRCLPGFALLPFFSCTAEKAPQKPSIVLILIDDMGWGDIGYNSSDIRSPNLDKLAESGVRLTHHYVNPECTPTRVSLLTGMFPNRFGLHCSSASNDQAFPFETLTLASALKSVGYQTAICGKWHLGSLPEWGPMKYGFDHSYGGLAGAVGMYDHRYRLDREPYTRTWVRNDKYFDEEGHAYDIVTDHAIGLLENTFSKDKPFFLYLPYNGVHAPLVESREWLDFNNHIENPSRRLFAAAVSHLDHQIGRIIEELNRRQMRDNTLIIVMSDNGGFPNYSGGQYPAPDPPLKNFSSNGPLRGAKGTPYEGGIRVPAFVNWPDILEPGAVDAVIHAIDWMPTICSLAGYESDQDPKWDGQNIWPVIRGEIKGFDEPRLLYWNYWDIRIAFRHGDWKIISPAENAPFEMYNLAVDPYEQNDLAGSDPEQFESLLKKLGETRALDRKGPAPWVR